MRTRLISCFAVLNVVTASIITLVLYNFIYSNEKIDGTAISETNTTSYTEGIHNKTEVRVTSQAFTKETPIESHEEHNRPADEKLPDCIASGKSAHNSQYSSTQKLNSSTNLCQAFTGRITNDCIYNHTNIVHYVKLMKNDTKYNYLRFQDFISILSVDRFYKPEKIVIHYNRQPITGKYWEIVAKLSTPIELKYVDRVLRIGNSNRKPGFITHEADVIKVRLALKEGGMYMDFDTAIINGSKLRQQQRSSECIFGRDDDPCSRTCAGLFSCAARSKFVEKWLEGYKIDYKQEHWYHNAGVYPAHVLLKCPDCYDVLVDGSMSNWDEARSGAWLKPNGVNWQERAAVHYMNAGFMNIFNPVDKLLEMDTSFTAMIKYVLGERAKDFI